MRFIFLLVLSLWTACTAISGQQVPEHVRAGADSLISPELKRLRLLYGLDSTDLARYDKIITFDREVFVAHIHNITYSEVRFTQVGEETLTALNRSRVSQIHYADGRIDVFIPLEDRTLKQKNLADSNRIIIKSQKDWMKVRITEDPADVVQLVEKAEVKARYEAEKGNVSNDELMRQVGIRLRKKAASLKSPWVLIDSKFFHKAYGDLPVVEVVARVFGY
jgi:hypothetical protein